MNRFIHLFLILLLLLYSSISIAASVKLTWDANNPTPEGYRIFYRQIDGAYNYTSPSWQGEDVIGVINDLEDGNTYAFVVRAYDGPLESADSNEVVYTPPLPQQVIVYPKQPRSITIKFE